MGKTLFASLVVSAVALFSQNAYSDFHFLVNNGVTCQVMNASQEGLLEWKAIGLVNKSTTTDVWVACPFISTRHDGIDPTINAGFVTMWNNGTASVSTTCLYREVGVDGTVWKTVSRSVTMPGDGGGLLVFDHFTAIAPDYLSAATVACLLPRNSQLTGIYQFTDHP